MSRTAKTLTPADRLLCIQVVGLYRLVLRRLVDPGGLADSLNRLREGEPFPAMIARAMQSDEFRQLHPDPVDSPEKIDELFIAAFGYQPPRLRNLDRDGSVAAYAADLLAAEHQRTPMQVCPALYPDGVDPNDDVAYQLWLADYQAPNAPAAAAMMTTAAGWPACITVSLILLAGASRWTGIAEAIASVKAQLVAGFELIVVASRDICEQASRAEPAIKAITVNTHDFVDNYNAALPCCSGEFVFVLPPDLRLAPDAAFHFGAVVHADPGQRTVAITCDSDSIDTDGRRFASRFRSGWDPELALSRLDWAESMMLRTSAVRAVGGARHDYAGCAPQDLALRVIETAGHDRVRHIPRMLLSQQIRRSWTSRFRPAVTGRVRSRTWSRMLSDRHGNGPAPGLVATSNATLFRVVYPLPAQKPLVSVIIPTRDKLSLLRPCIEGLLQRTEYRPIEIVVVNNRSEEPETLRYLSDLAARPEARVLDFDADFNWGAINNAGVKASRGEIALLLNNDTDVTHADWLTELSAQAMRPEVGVVGAKLLYQNQTVQHAGLVLGPDGHAFHRFRHVSGNEPGYDDALATVRTVTAVTGACLAIRRAVFDEIGGIEERNLAVTWSDVDLCLRARSRGYRVIVTPFARLLHLELATRGADDTPERVARADRERDYMLKKWPVLLEEDRFFNANFMLAEGETRLDTPPRISHRLTAKDT